MDFHVKPGLLDVDCEKVDLNKGYITVHTVKGTSHTGCLEKIAEFHNDFETGYLDTKMTNRLYCLYDQGCIHTKQK